MDYSVVNAMSYNSSGLEEFLIIYDIACQWGVYFEDRIEESPLLSLPASCQQILYAVGKFHLGAHVESCFFMHSLNFIEGVGQVDGEIIETLWSILNKLSVLTRVMTKSYRRESLDHGMRDHNWKKLVTIGRCPLWSVHITISMLMFIFSPLLGD